MSDPSIKVRVLLVTPDLHAIDCLSHILQRLAVHAEICCDAAMAPAKLCRAKFEAIVLDFEAAEAARRLLEHIRESSAHSGTILFALLSESAANTLPSECGVHFVIRWPFSQIELTRMFRAAYSMMVRERRRCYRCPVDVPVVVERTSGSSASAQTANISEGGIALITSAGLRVGESIRLTGKLPGTAKPITVQAEVCWAMEDRYGMQFRNVPAKVQEVIQTWLSERLDARLPESHSRDSQPVLRS